MDKHQRRWLPSRLARGRRDSGHGLRQQAVRGRERETGMPGPPARSNGASA